MKVEIIYVSILIVMRRSILIFCALCCASSCSLQERLKGTSDDIQAHYDSIQDWDKLPLRVISWRQALAMIKENNSEIRTAQSTIESAQRSANSVYTDLIPSVSYYGYFNNTIEELTTGNTSSDDMYSNININFSIPTMTQVPYRMYAAQATVFAAEKALEGKQRELSVKLYKLLRQREVEEQLQALQQQSTFDFKQNAMDAQSLRSTEAVFWRSISQLLGNGEARWLIDTNTMPRVHWAQYKDKIDQLDPLILCNFAMQIESARLSQYGIALSYLPTINTNLSSPSLFNSSGGTYSGTFLNSDDTILNLSISYSLDTNLSKWNSYKTNKENFTKVCEEVEAALMDRRTQLKSLVQSVHEYEVWLGYMKKRMDFERAAPCSTSAEFIEKQSTIQSMKKELLNQEKTAIESESALATEYGCPSENL